MFSFFSQNKVTPPLYLPRISNFKLNEQLVPFHFILIIRIIFTFSFNSDSDKDILEDEKSFMMGKDHREEQEELSPATIILLSDQPLLEDEDEEADVYMMEDADMDNEDCDDDDMMDEAVKYAAGTQNDQDEDSSFYLEDDEEEDAHDNGLVVENPFEPVYPATSAGLLFSCSTDEQAPQGDDTTQQGMVLEAISLDNILPAGSRRRRN